MPFKSTNSHFRNVFDAKVIVIVKAKVIVIVKAKVIDIFFNI
jgi:hypothetical protein